MFASRSAVGFDGGLIFTGISSTGHDYLDAVRNPETWAKTKERVTAVGGATFGVVKDIAVAYVKAELQKHGWI